jgi:hypothetical protein
MTDRPYTDDDLRAEAARQHAAFLRDPAFMRIGKQMTGTVIPSRNGEPRACWHDLDDLDGDAFVDAQRAIADLLTNAADISEWAINLGADGLEPLPEQLSAQTDTGPWFRLHFAVRPDMPDDMRRALVEGVGAEIAKHF